MWKENRGKKQTGVQITTRNRRKKQPWRNQNQQQNQQQRSEQKEVLIRRGMLWLWAGGHGIVSLPSFDLSPDASM